MSEEYLRQLKRIRQQTDSLLQGGIFNIETLVNLQMETEKLCELNKKKEKTPIDNAKLHNTHIKYEDHREDYYINYRDIETIERIDGDVYVTTISRTIGFKNIDFEELNKKICN